MLYLPVASDGEGGMQQLGWYPDPTGRHEQRFFDGNRWTDHVADAGQMGTDRIAPPAPPVDQRLRRGAIGRRLRCSSASRSPRAAGDADGGLEIEGVHTLTDEDVVGGATSCHGTGGYSDFEAGTPVTVRNESGDIIGAGHLRNAASATEIVERMMRCKPLVVLGPGLSAAADAVDGSTDLT